MLVGGHQGSPLDGAAIVRSWDWDGIGAIRDAWNGSRFDFTKQTAWAAEQRAAGRRIVWTVGGMPNDQAACIVDGPYGRSGFTASPKSYAFLSSYVRELVAAIAPDYLSGPNEPDPYGWCAKGSHFHGENGDPNDRDGRLAALRSYCKAIKTGAGAVPYLGPDLVSWSDVEADTRAIATLATSLLDGGLAVHAYDTTSAEIARRVNACRAVGLDCWLTEVGGLSGRPDFAVLEQAARNAGARCFIRYDKNL